MFKDMFNKMVESFDWIEIVGIIAMLFVLLSFMMRAKRHIRFVNTIGAVFWVVYGFLRPSFTTFAMNLLLIVINIVMLVSEQREHINKHKNDNLGENNSQKGQ